MKRFLLNLLISVIVGLAVQTTINQAFAEDPPRAKLVSAKACSVKDGNGKYINEGKTCLVSTQPTVQLGKCQQGICK